MEIKRLKMDIIPNTIFFDGKKFTITKVHEEMFKIRQVDFVVSGDSKIQKVLIGKKHHPNAINDNSIVKPPDEPADDTEWCMPAHLKNQPYEKAIARKIVDLIQVWNYNDCHWKTWDSDWIKYIDNETIELTKSTKAPKGVVDYILKKEPSNTDEVRLKMRQFWVSIFDLSFKAGDKFIKYLRDQRARM